MTFGSKLLATTESGQGNLRLLEMITKFGGIIENLHEFSQLKFDLSESQQDSKELQRKTKHSFEKYFQFEASISIPVEPFFNLAKLLIRKIFPHQVFSE